MDLALKEKRVLLAGSSRGLGLALARAFSTEGAHVWLTGRDTESLKSASRELAEAPFTIGDLQQPSGRSQLVSEVAKKWNRLDILILNIGSGRCSAQGLETSDSEWTRVLDLNLLTHVALLRDLLPLLKTSKQATVVGISSIAGLTRLSAPLSYSVAKAALNAFCSGASAELARSGIRYNLVAPGNVWVEGGRWSELRQENPDSVDRYISTQVPLQRFARPEEVAAQVLFVASPLSSFTTGTIVRVDGGQVP